MLKKLIGVAALKLAVIAAPMAMAQNVAIMLIHDEYTSYPAYDEPKVMRNARNALRDAGFDIFAARNTAAADLPQTMLGMVQAMADAERVIVITDGYIASSARDSWLLATDAEAPNPLSVGGQGVSLGAVSDALGAFPENAILMVAERMSDHPFGPGLANGFILETIPEGVTVASGEPRALRSLLFDTVLVPGANLADGASAIGDGVQLSGFVPESGGFLPGEDDGDSSDEDRLWEVVSQRDGPAAYRLYLEAFPEGKYADEARARLSADEETPEDRAKRLEDRMELSRDDRRDIQRQLLLIGFDPFGIDGIFGNRSRAAIKAFQASIDVEETGYLTANQVTRLERQAARRAEQLAKEAEARRIAEEKADTAYWNDTGVSGDEADLRAYLEKYPDGLFSQKAKRQLKAIQREKRRLAEAAERDAWDAAVTKGTVQSYRAYIKAYPKGAFVEEARTQVRALRNPETPVEVVEAARAAEGALNLNPITRQLIEQRLARLNIDPGPVDGKFTNETRRAIRKFQRASELPVTGFVTRNDVAHLLASRLQ